MIEYRVGETLDVEAARDLYRSCTLGARRPIEDDARFSLMLQNANLVVAAWDGDLLVGIARTLTDWSYVSYVADLAVRESHQKRGIGTVLLRKTRECAPQTQLVLFAAPQAVDYYERIGFARHPSGWTLQPHEPL
jgi:GNAT superfamily N-acetyltransferase